MRWTSFHCLLVVSVTLVAGAPFPKPDLILPTRGVIPKHHTPCGSEGSPAANVTSPADGSPSSVACGSFTSRASTSGASISDYGVLKRAVAPRRQSARLANQAKASQSPRRSARLANQERKANAKKAVLKKQSTGGKGKQVASGKKVQDGLLCTKDLRDPKFRKTASGGKKSSKQADHCGELQIYCKHLNDKGYTRGKIKPAALKDFKGELNDKKNSKMISPEVNQAKGRATRATLGGRPVKPKDKTLLKNHTVWKKPATRIAKNMNAVAKKHKMKGVDFVAAQENVTKALK